MENRKELFTALVNAKKNFKTIKKNTQGYGYKYATLDGVIAAIDEALLEQGLTFIQDPISKVIEGNFFIGMCTGLVHESGQSRFTEFFHPTSKPSDAQITGSHHTYDRRYALLALFGLAPAPEEDDDGRATAIRDQPQKRDTELNPAAYVFQTNLFKCKGMLITEKTKEELGSMLKWAKSKSMKGSDIDAIELYLSDSGR